ncbi:MAG: amidohydrolase family protein, partial [Gemmatimonadales bacterium]
GITTVGEFHYLHHHSATRDYAFDSTVLEAAREAGIRLVLLNAFYRMGGFGQQLKSEQQRFRSDSVSEFLGNMDSLRAHVTGNQQLGVVAHSVRAVPVADIIELHRGARDRDLPFHLHIEEQRREIEECIHATGKTPMRLLLDAIEDATAVTAVHATHTDADDLGEFLRRGGAVCVCPLTEGNLGDGIPGAHITAAELVCLGTDSNERIDMFEEMRWLEYGQRLRGEMRGAFRDDTGEVAPRLLRAATVVGAASLSVSAGSIAVGKSADFCAVKLNHPTLRGIEPRGLASALVFGCDASVVDSTWVGGKRVF